MNHWNLCFTMFYYIFSTVFWKKYARIVQATVTQWRWSSHQYVQNNKQLSTGKWQNKTETKTKSKIKLRIISEYVQTWNVFFNFRLLKKPITYVVPHSLPRLSILTRPVFDCLKLTMESKEHVWNLFNVNNTYTRMTSLTSPWCIY